jgi:hypothetical protein
VLVMPLFVGVVMTVNDLWYLFIFAWGLISAWAVVEGLK